MYESQATLAPIAIAEDNSSQPVFTTHGSYGNLSAEETPELSPSAGFETGSSDQTEKSPEAEPDPSVGFGLDPRARK
jgi:hypothetical protein